MKYKYRSSYKYKEERSIYWYRVDENNIVECCKPSSSEWVISGLGIKWVSLMTERCTKKQIYSEMLIEELNK